MTLRRLELLQWFGFVAGGVIWFTLFVAGAGVSVATCNPVGQARGVPYDAVQLALLLFGLLALAGAEAAAVLVFRATSRAKDDDPPPDARLRFFAIGAMVGNLLFFMILALAGIATIVDRTCHQA